MSRACCSTCVQFCIVSRNSPCDQVHPVAGYIGECGAGVGRLNGKEQLSCCASCCGRRPSAAVAQGLSWHVRRCADGQEAAVAAAAALRGPADGPGGVAVLQRHRQPGLLLRQRRRRAGATLTAKRQRSALGKAAVPSKSCASQNGACTLSVRQQRSRARRSQQRAEPQEHGV